MSLHQKLRQLYLLDQQVRGLRGRLDSATNRHQAQQNKLNQLGRQRSEIAEQLKQVQAKATALEKQAREIEEKVGRLREQMNTVKNNKEYSALLVEVSTFKNDKTKVEDEALTQMARVDELRKELEAAEAKVREQEKLVGVAQNEVNAARAEVGQQLDEATAKRGAAEQELPADARAAFNKTARVHEGEAMAPIVEESRRHMEYSCGGCYIGLPPERVSALLRGADQLVICPSCGRILYMEDELKSSLSGSK